jgi:hypothetical protein
VSEPAEAAAVARKLLEDPVDPLPASQVGRKILVRRSDFDAYLERHRRKPDGIVEEILKKLT